MKLQFKKNWINFVLWAWRARKRCRKKFLASHVRIYIWLTKLIIASRKKWRVVLQELFGNLYNILWTISESCARKKCRKSFSRRPSEFIYGWRNWSSPAEKMAGGATGTMARYIHATHDVTSCSGLAAHPGNCQTYRTSTLGLQLINRNLIYKSLKICRAFAQRPNSGSTHCSL